MQSAITDITDIHRGTHSDCLKPLEHLDTVFGILLSFTVKFLFFCRFSHRIWKYLWVKSRFTLQGKPRHSTVEKCYAKVRNFHQCLALKIVLCTMRTNLWKCLFFKDIRIHPCSYLEIAFLPSASKDMISIFIHHEFIWMHCVL